MDTTGRREDAPGLQCNAIRPAFDRPGRRADRAFCSGRRHPQRRRGGGAGRATRAVVGHQSGPADEAPEERGRVEVDVAVAEAEVQVAFGRADDAAGRDHVTGAQR